MWKEITMTSENHFGENLKALRQNAGLTRKELSEKVQVHENTLAGYEVSGREPRLDMLIKFADFFDVSLDELVRSDPKSDKIVKKIPADVIDQAESLEITSSISGKMSATYAVNLLTMALDAIDKTDINDKTMSVQLKIINNFGGIQ